MKRVKIYAGVRKMTGETDPLKVCVVRPLDNGIVRQCINDFSRYLFAVCQINDMNFAAVSRIPEQQYFKVVRLRIFVHTALGEVDAAVCFDIYTQYLHGFPFHSPKGWYD